MLDMQLGLLDKLAALADSGDLHDCEVAYNMFVEMRGSAELQSTGERSHGGDGVSVAHLCVFVATRQYLYEVF